MFSFSWRTYYFYCCSVSNILFLTCWCTGPSSENDSFSSFSAAREHFIDDIHALKLITASENETEKYTAGTCICWVCSHACSFHYYETFIWIFQVLIHINTKMHMENSKLYIRIIYVFSRLTILNNICFCKIGKGKDFTSTHIDM